MLSIFGALSMTPCKPVRPARTPLTPGQLYRMLSSEFRLHRSPRCGCRMPMVFACARPAPDEANWNVEANARHCADCRGLTARIVSHFREIYDINDPGWTSAPAQQEADEADVESLTGRRVFG